MTTKEFYSAVKLSTGYTSYRIAKELGVSRSLTHSWENGGEIGFENAQRVCDTLGLKLDCILAKHSQQQSLTNSANQVYKNEER